METPTRNYLLFGIMALILGAVLLCIGIAAQPDREVHTGYVILNNQQELDAFSTSVLLNDISRSEYSIKGSDFPYVVSLEVVTLPDSAFAYGKVKPASSWNIHAMDTGIMVGNFLLRLAGIIVIVIGIFYTIPIVLWPKLTSHNIRFKTEWIPYKKKGTEVS